MPRLLRERKILRLNKGGPPGRADHERQETDRQKGYLLDHAVGIGARRPRIASPRQLMNLGTLPELQPKAKQSPLGRYCAGLGHGFVTVG